MATRGRQTIAMRIALDGGEEIKRELQALGKEGEAAFKKLQDASRAFTNLDALKTRLAALNAQLKTTGEAARSFGSSFAAVSSRFGEIGSAMSSMVTRIGVLTGALTGLGALFVKLVKDAGNFGDTIDEAMQQTGLSAEQWQAWSIGAEQAGISSEKFVQILGKLSKGLESLENTDPNEFASIPEALAKGWERVSASIDETGKKMVTLRVPPELGGGLRQFEIDITKTGDKIKGAKEDGEKFAATLEKIGIKAAELKGKSPADVLLRLADAFAKMPDGAAKTAASLELFGRGGQKMIVFLNQGSEGLRKMMRDFKELGIIMDENDFKSLAKANDQLDAFGKALESIKAQILLSFAPELAKASEALLQFWGENRKEILQWVRDMQGRAIQVVKDFIAVLQGRQGDVKNQWVVDFTRKVEAFGATLTKVKDLAAAAFAAIWSGLERLTKFINETFGTDLKPEDVALVLILGKISGGFRLIKETAGLAIDGFLLVLRGSRLLHEGIKLLIGVLGLGGAAAGAGAGGGLAGALRALPGLMPPVGIALGALALAVADNWTLIKTKTEEFWSWLTKDQKGRGAQAATGAKTFLDVLRADFEKGLADLRATTTRELEGIFRALEDGWPKVRDTTQREWEGLKSLFLAGIKAIDESIKDWQFVGALLASMDFAKVKEATEREFKAIDGVIAAALKQIDKTLGDFGINAGLEKSWADFKATTQREWDAIVKIVEGSVERIKNALKGTFGENNNAWKNTGREIEDIQKFLGRLFRELGIGSAKAADEANANLGRIGEGEASGTGVGAGFRTAFGQVKADAIETKENIVATFNQLTTELGLVAQQIPQLFEPHLAAIEAKIRAVIEAVRQAQTLLGEVQPGAAAAAGTEAQNPFAVLEQQATAAFERIKVAAQALATAITTALSGIGGGVVAAAAAGGGEAAAAAGGAAAEGTQGAAAGGLFAGVEQAATAAIGRVKQAFEQLKTDIETAFANLAVDWSVLQDGATTALEEIRTAITDAIGGLGDDISEIFDQIRILAEDLAKALVDTLGGIKIDWTGVLGNLVAIADQIKGKAGEISAAFRTAMADVVSAVQAAAAQIETALAAVEARIRAVAAAAAQAASAGGGGGGGGGTGFAAGGHVRGLGGPTDDRIPAWLSAGEFVLRASAVRKYGAKFLAALNAGRFDIRKLEGFATGGLVQLPPMRQRFSTGGLVRGLSIPRAARPTMRAARVTSKPMTPINLSIGGVAAGTVLAPADTAANLNRLAQMQQIRQAGRKPGWY